MEMNEFYKNLATKLTPANVNSKMKINDYYDAVELEWPVENDLKKTVLIRADKNKKHTISVDEIWIGCLSGNCVDNDWLIIVPFQI